MEWQQLSQGSPLDVVPGQRPGHSERRWFRRLCPNLSAEPAVLKGKQQPRQTVQSAVPSSRGCDTGLLPVQQGWAGGWAFFFLDVVPGQKAISDSLGLERLWLKLFELLFVWM
ncbi:uncharacterized protein LOC144104472 [Amblyomma americanum]